MMKNFFLTLGIGVSVSTGLCVGLHAQTNDPNKVDDDGDGLIEIWSLTDLNNMRYDMAGASYDDEADDGSGNEGDKQGCGTALTGAKKGKCHGYELMADLDFRAGCGDEGTAASACTYPAWVPTNNADPTASGATIAAPASGLNPGWEPIGNDIFSDDGRFSGVFEGNGYQIKNLYIRSSTQFVGLFGTFTRAKGGFIRNVGLTGEHMFVYGVGSGGRHVGGLVARYTSISGVFVRNCYVTGKVKGVEGGNNKALYVGGLVGNANKGTLSDCYATGEVEAVSTATGSGSISYAGGLAGNNATLVNCYATGNVRSEKTTSDRSANAQAGGLLAARSTAPVPARSYRLSSATVQAVTPGSNKAVGNWGTAKTLEELKALTAASTGWDTKDWDFGTSEDLPVLQIYREVNGVRVQGLLLRGQSFSLTPEGMVVELRTLVDDYTTDVDKAVSGETYLRVKRLVSEVGKIEDKADKSELAKYLTEADADKKYAAKATEGKVTAAEGKISTLEGKMTTSEDKITTLQTDMDAAETDIDNLETAVGTDGDTSDATGSLYARVAQNKADIAGKANASALDGKADKTALTGKADVGASYTKAEANKKLALKADKTALAGKADKTALALKAEASEVYTQTAADKKFALKSELPKEANLSGYVKKADFDALKKELEELKKSVSGGARFDPVWATAWLETRIVVRPNPVRDRLVVESPVSVVATVLDSSGQLLLTRQLPRGEQSLDVSGLSSGSYLLILQTEDGASSTHKFVKEHQ